MRKLIISFQMIFIQCINIMIRVFYVQGILLSAKKNVMRTNGVIVDALLGDNPALDEYSENLQTYNNQMLASRILNEELARVVVHNSNKEQAEVFDIVFHPTGNENEKDEGNE